MQSTTEIWRDYHQALRRFVSRRVSNPADVEDLLQDVLLRTHVNLDALENEDNLRAWIFRIARNAITDYYRSSTRRQTPHPDDLWYGEATPAVLEELEECVEPFLNALEPADSDLLRQSLLLGRSQKDMAADQGVSYSTMKSRVQTARTRLHRAFTDCCSFEFDQLGAVSDYSLKPNRCKKC